MKPFFTIITATYNADKVLPSLLASLESQTCKDFIWACQDGGSTDSTLAVAKLWQEKFPRTFIQSEKDSGIYDAWNKCIIQQEDRLGKWILFLGADDQLAQPDVLEKVKNICQTLPKEVTLAAGQMQQVDNRKKYSVREVDIQQDFIHRLHYMPLPHTALFSRKELFQKNLFDPQFTIAGDKEWLLRIWKKPEQAISLNFLTTYMNRGGISDNINHAVTLKKENRKILWMHRPSKLRQWPIYTFTCFEIICYSLKMNFKTLLEKNAITKRFWRFLHEKRKSFLKKHR